MDATLAYPINAVVKPRLSPMVNLKSPTAGLRAIRHRNPIFEVQGGATQAEVIHGYFVSSCNSSSVFPVR
jgi:hypothetical protein